MSSVNKVILIGHLGADPELRDGRGQPVCNLRIATSESWTDKDGSKQERTEWHRVTVWGKQAEFCGQYLSKGRQVYIEGRIESKEYTDKDGNERRSYGIVAREVTFLGSRNDGGGGQRGGQGNQGGGWGGNGGGGNGGGNSGGGGW